MLLMPTESFLGGRDKMHMYENMDEGLTGISIELRE